MINRLVKLSFSASTAPTFIEIFHESQDKIRAFPGCRHLELWEAHGQKGIFFTFSQWESAEALDQYRFSPLFNTVWARVKPLFNAPAEAWTLSQHLKKS